MQIFNKRLDWKTILFSSTIITDYIVNVSRIQYSILDYETL